MTTKQWTVQVALDERGDDTFADAVLRFDERQISAHGESRRNPSDEAVPRIGDELATARALTHLGRQLLATAATDIEARTHTPIGSLQL